MNTASEIQVKQQVRQFYDEVGWQEVGEGVYQNARYEDLRPVSREYIHRCHLRVKRHLSKEGQYFLDAGSGPIQYPEYLEYSRGYQARVCADISIVALQEARCRIGDKKDNGQGLFVVADVAYLPFEQDTFDGVVSLHTIHHIPEEEHRQAYLELFRVLASQKTAVIVNGWERTSAMSLFVLPYRWMKRLRIRLRNIIRKDTENSDIQRRRKLKSKGNQKSTYVSKHNPDWLKREIGTQIPLEIYVWRSVSVSFLRAYIRPNLGGEWFLGQLFRLEDRFPHFMGENGQYPMIVLKKDLK